MTDDVLHSGVKRRSGRYPWGSGKDPQRSMDVMARKDELSAKGLSQVEIAKELGMNTTQLRNALAVANSERKNIIMDQVRSRAERGESDTKISEDLGVSESTVRNYKKKMYEVQTKQVNNIVDSLRSSVDEHEYLDIGAGVEIQMGISKAKMKAAVSALEADGYTQHKIYVRRLTDPSKYTTVKVLTKEKDLEVVKKNSDKIRPVESWTDDGGLTMLGIRPIENISWDRVHIKYGDEGGVDKDGVIELRRGVKDLDMQDKRYAQVRIGVDGTHYLKGMAMYSDDLPPGKDIVFNTNKPKGTPREKVLKPLKDNPNNPFGATIKQGRQLGALNIVNEEGDWLKWKSPLSAQFLSKQPVSLINERLNVTFDKILADHAEINSLTNPVVKKHLLEAYANELDGKVKHLKVQALPNTKGHVILPFPDMNSNEVYAPGYNDGDRVVLIRYPHGGIFEIPELTVNNKGPAKKTLGNAVDAIGIHPSVASKLSGADFDGDTVYVMPNNSKKIKVSRSLPELKDFDAIAEYQVDYDTITPKRKQTQMGIVSNLITDMTIKGASQSEIAKAVRHSMVVIDSEKHKLDYKRSAADNGIAALQTKYQTHIGLDGKTHKGASTLISKSKRMNSVEEENPITGKIKKTKVALVDQVDDARMLSSGTAKENLYADYINKVKAIRNTTLKEAESIPPIKRDKEVAAKYASEVKSLNDKLNIALLNAPKERQAQIYAANAYYTNRTDDMEPDQLKKLKAQAIATARIKTGAGKEHIVIEPKEWEAIQAGALSNEMLTNILKNTNLDVVKKLATPQQSSALSSAKVARANLLFDKGYTYAEVASSMGVSVAALRSAINTEAFVNNNDEVE